jgi:hypothetical protein
VLSALKQLPALFPPFRLAKKKGLEEIVANEKRIFTDQEDAHRID